MPYATVNQSKFVFKYLEPKRDTSKWNIFSFEFSINSIIMMEGLRFHGRKENSEEKDCLKDPSTNLFLQKAIYLIMLNQSHRNLKMKSNRQF